MTCTNLRSYSLVALIASGAFALACGGGSSSGGSGGSSNSDGGSKNTGGSGDGGSGGSNGGSGTTADAGDNPAPGALCKRVAQIQCQGEAACCSSPGRTESACETAQLAVCAQTLSLDAVAMDSVTGFDQTTSNAAIAQFDQLAKSCDTSIAAFGISTTGLRGIAQGTVDPGGTCNPAKTGATPVAATAAALVSCKDPSTNACLPAASGMDWKCQPRADAGGACFTDANCKDGLYCDNPMYMLTGAKCAARKATGADCTAGNECTSLGCKSGKCVDQTKDTAYCLKASM